MSTEQQFCLRWHNYQSSLLASLPQLLDGDDLTDVTLMAGGCNLKAHRVVLSACSQYFKELFKVLQPLQHPVVVLPGAKFTDLCALVTFMYSGEVNIYQEQLQGLLSMADALQIRGLAEVNANSGKTSKTGVPVSALHKKDAGNTTCKRARVSTQPNMQILNTLSPDVLHTISSQPQSVTKECQNNKTKQSIQDIYGSLMKTVGASTFEYSGFKSDTNFNRGSDRNGNASETFNILAETLRKNVRNQSSKQIETNTLNYMDDPLLTPPSSSAMQDLLAEEISMQAFKVKNEGVSDSNISADLESSTRGLKRTVLDDDEMVVKMCGLQEDQSPSSSESTTDNGNGTVDMGLEHVHHLSQGSNFSKLASSSSSHYTKLWSSPQIINSKLFATCFICGKQLSNQYNLRVHMETHQNVNYACSVCSHVSRSRDALRKHVSYRHPGEVREKGGNACNLSDGQIGAGVEDILGRGKKFKVSVNKDSNNNKPSSHP